MKILPQSVQIALLYSNISEQQLIRKNSYLMANTEDRVKSHGVRTLVKIGQYKYDYKKVIVEI